MARLTYNQIAEILTEAYAQATGRKAIGNIPFANMVQVFGTATPANQDNLYGVLEGVLAKTLFAVRPISEPFLGLEWDEQKYGDYLRKLTPITTEPLDNEEWSIAAEAAKENPNFSCCSAPVTQDFLAVRISGGNTFARKWTMFRNQVNSAFRSQAEVAEFFSMLATERANRMKLDRISVKRSLINNAILGAVTYYAGENVNARMNFKALTAYNSATGLSLTKADIMQPSNFREFLIWLKASIDTLRKMMREASAVFHFNVPNKAVDRHTPAGYERLYILTKYATYFRANEAGLYNPDRLPDIGDYEEVNYWQNPDDPETVKGQANILYNDGSIVNIGNSTVQNVVALLTDRDFMGTANIDTWTAPEPYNARFGYQNTWYHNTYRSLLDWTENCIVITLD